MWDIVFLLILVPCPPVTTYSAFPQFSLPAAGTTPAYEDSTYGVEVPEVDNKPLLPPASPTPTVTNVKKGFKVKDWARMLHVWGACMWGMSQLSRFRFTSLRGFGSHPWHGISLQSILIKCFKSMQGGQCQFCLGWFRWQSGANRWEVALHG